MKDLKFFKIDEVKGKFDYVHAIHPFIFFVSKDCIEVRNINNDVLQTEVLSFTDVYHDGSKIFLVDGKQITVINVAGGRVSMMKRSFEKEIGKMLMVGSNEFLLFKDKSLNVNGNYLDNDTTDIFVNESYFYILKGISLSRIEISRLAHFDVFPKDETIDLEEFISMRVFDNDIIVLITDEKFIYKYFNTKELTLNNYIHEEGAKYYCGHIGDFIFITNDKTGEFIYFNLTANKEYFVIDEQYEIQTKLSEKLEVLSTLQVSVMDNYIYILNSESVCVFVNQKEKKVQIIEEMKIEWIDRSIVENGSSIISSNNEESRNYGLDSNETDRISTSFDEQKPDKLFELSEEEILSRKSISAANKLIDKKSDVGGNDDIADSLKDENIGDSINERPDGDSLDNDSVEDIQKSNIPGIKCYPNVLESFGGASFGNTFFTKKIAEKNNFESINKSKLIDETKSLNDAIPVYKPQMDDTRSLNGILGGLFSGSVKKDEDISAINRIDGKPKDIFSIPLKDKHSFSFNKPQDNALNGAFSIAPKHIHSFNFQNADHKISQGDKPETSVFKDHSTISDNKISPFGIQKNLNVNKESNNLSEPAIKIQQTPSVSNITIPEDENINPYQREYNRIKRNLVNDFDSLIAEFENLNVPEYKYKKVDYSESSLDLLLRNVYEKIMYINNKNYERDIEYKISLVERYLKNIDSNNYTETLNYVDNFISNYRNKETFIPYNYVDDLNEGIQNICIETGDKYLNKLFDSLEFKPKNSEVLPNVITKETTNTASNLYKTSFFPPNKVLNTDKIGDNLSKTSTSDKNIPEPKVVSFNANLNDSGNLPTQSESRPSNFLNSSNLNQNNQNNVNNQQFSSGVFGQPTAPHENLFIQHPSTNSFLSNLNLNIPNSPQPSGQQTNAPQNDNPPDSNSIFSKFANQRNKFFK